jgi:hypothetical protein
MAKDLRIKFSQVGRGDVILDGAGQPYFKVDRAYPARAKNYIVCVGVNLRDKDGSMTAGGHKDDVVTVRHSDSVTVFENEQDGLDVEAFQEQKAREISEAMEGHEHDGSCELSSFGLWSCGTTDQH